MADTVHTPDGLWLPSQHVKRRTRDEQIAGAVTGVALAVKALPAGTAVNTPQLLAAASMSIASQFGSTPDDVAEAMREQGLDSAPPFSPGRPLDPYRQLGEPARLWNFPVGSNIVVTPRNGRTSFDTIAKIIDAYDVAQICIRHLTNDVRSLPLMFQPMDGVTDDVSDDIAKAKAFFRKPDGRHSFRAWLAMVLDDMLRFDAPALYKRRDRTGRLIGLEPVSGRTIIPLIDYYGRRPTGQSPAFLQVVTGMPWVWLYDTDLIYEPLNPRADSQYGTAPIELVLMRANTDLRFQWYLLQRFTEGNVPAAFIEAPEGATTAAALTELQEAWDAFNAGQQLRKSQARFIPHGATITPFRENGFDKEMALYLFRLTAASYGVVPNDLGVTDDVNRATGDTQVDVQYRIGPKPIGMHLEDIIDDVCQQDLGLRVQARFDDGQEKEDRLTEAQAHDIYVKMGAESPDEVRRDVLGLAVQADEMTPRFIFSTKAGAIPLRSIAEVAGQIDMETGAPVAGSVVQAKLAPGQYVAPAGVVPAPDDVDSVLGGNRPGSKLATSAPVAAVPSGESSVGVAKSVAPVAAGIALCAADTGRVLMLQRALDDPDPASGTWEFPGGCLEPDEDAFAAACREWCEEVGNLLPACTLAGDWLTANGVYRGFVLVVEREASVRVNCDGENRFVANPDDPDCDDVETVVWLDPAHLDGFPGLRAELADSTALWLPQVTVAASGPVAKAYNPDQPRDDNGRWGEGGGSAANSEVHDQIKALGEKTSAKLPNQQSPSGEPVRREMKIINGHRVTARVTGFAKDDPVKYEVDMSTEQLTLEQAAERVMKSVNSGITSGTGITGVDLAGAATDNGIDPEVMKLLALWRRSASRRVAKGVRPVRFDDVPAKVADVVWARLETAATRDDVDAAFDVVVKATGRPKALSRREVEDRLIDHYGPKLSAALSARVLWPHLKTRIAQAPAELGRLVAKAADEPDVRAAVRAWLADNLNPDTGTLSDVLSQLYTEAGTAGANVAAGNGTLPHGAAPVDWETWAPGNQAAGDFGVLLPQRLDALGVTIQGITDTQLDVMAGWLAIGLDTGASMDQIAANLDEALGTDGRGMLIARTETCRAVEEASQATYAANGVEQWEWLLGENACDECEPYDGTLHDVGEQLIPLHPSCRCASAAVTSTGAEAPDEGSDAEEG